MSTEIRDRSTVHRTTYKAIETYEQAAGEGIPARYLPGLVGVDDEDESLAETVSEAVEDLKAHGEIFEVDGRLHAAGECEFDEPETVKAAVEQYVAESNETSGVPRALVERQFDEAVVESAVARGEVYPVGRRLKVTRK